jgi:hypothetical protein
MNAKKIPQAKCVIVHYNPGSNWKNPGKLDSWKNPGKLDSWKNPGKLDSWKNG